MTSSAKRIVTLLAATALLAALALPAPAAAKLPPTGFYECVLASANQYLGDLRIKGDKYKVNKSAWGKLANPSGRKIRFNSGAWKGLFRGEWERAKSTYEPGKTIVEIELTEIESGFESSYCTKRS
ncbi:MAG TPA: hypothetical protein VEQ41_08170 [Solirubrobacterales bacterium]|nr:hypothetical protein [Solirubrobacterales bacterium]